MLDRTSTEPPAERARGAARFVPSRRGFLIGTGAALGLVVGYALWPRTYPNAWSGAEGEVPMNAWVRIAPDGRVTVAVPQAEMGQGIMSGFAQIVADELGADWRLVGVEPAPWHPAYAHVGIVREGTAGLPPMLRDIAAFAGAEVIRRLNLHLTGGSTSVRGYYPILRDAAAEARARLVAVAAAEWRVAASAIDTVGGFIVYKANRMAFADAVRKIDPEKAPPRAPLRKADAATLVGKAVTRIDIPAKVDGTARFGADVRIPGMVFAAIRHGPAASGRLASARAAAGTTLVKGDNWVAAIGITNFEAQRALAAADIRFATSGETAGPDMAGRLARLAAEGEAKPVESHGDIAAALGERPLLATYSVPMLAHACMEPMVATARVSDGRAEVWGPTQSITLAHWAVARALGIEDSDVTIHPTLLGGGFGRKAESDCLVQAALIARAVGKPVQLQWSREADFQADRFRPPAAAEMRGTLTADKRIAGWDARIAVPSVGASFIGRNMPRFASGGSKPSGAAIEGAEKIPYAVEAFRATHLPIELPLPFGYWRSVGHSFSAFFVESFIDELAAEAGEDPLAFRLRHLEDRPRHAAVLKAAADAGNWRDPAAEGLGRGIALHESFGSIVAMVVEAGVKDGQVRIARVASAIDCGHVINPNSVRAQLEGAAIMGLSAAMGEAMTFTAGLSDQRNFDGYPILRLADAPAITTVIVQSGAALGGVGEPGTPPAAPALANALYAATGTRARSLPLAATYVG